MLSYSHAKINLGLYINEKRSDGFHNLESIFLPIKLYDAIEILPSEENELHLYGLSIPGEKSKNSCLKTLELLQIEFNIRNYSIHLYKHIPLGAGLGGGSANSAFIIRMVNQLEELNLSIDQMRELAVKIGSDNAFFIEDETKYVTGRGELMYQSNFKTKDLKAVLIIPKVHQSTKEAYKNVTFEHPTVSLKSFSEGELVDAKLVNGFQKHFVAKYPETTSILDQFEKAGAIYSSLSGSGSSFYGLFNKTEAIPIELKLFSEKMTYHYFEVDFL